MTPSVYQTESSPSVAALFSGWKDTMITSCLQGVMGSLYVTDSVHPLSACACLNCFAFFAGKPDIDLISGIPRSRTMILTSKTEDWEPIIEKCFPNAKRVIRYAIRKDTVFSPERLLAMVQALPPEYDLRDIDGDLYDRCLESPVTEDFVSSFESKENFLRLGRGKVVLFQNRIVSGASSFSRYREGIEIEVDTVRDLRRRGLASAACAALILDCLENGLYPSWDAQNPVSVRLAEKLGYIQDRPYFAYELDI